MNIKDGSGNIPDEEGIDLPDVEAAKREALQCARDMLADAIKAGKPKVPEALEIADETVRALLAALPDQLRRMSG